jgi:hypothetical protein
LQVLWLLIILSLIRLEFFIVIAVVIKQVSSGWLFHFVVSLFISFKNNQYY